MRTNSKQRLFEVMQKVNPDFIIKEVEEKQTSEKYTDDELFLLYILVYNLMNAHILRDPEQTKSFIYDYNKKHGNVIKYPLVGATKDELVKKIGEFLYGAKVTDEQLMDLAQMDSKQIAPLLKQRYEFIRKTYKEMFMSKKEDTPDLEKIVDKQINDMLYQQRNDMEYYIRTLNDIEKYVGFPSSSDNLYSNFYEIFPVARPTWTGQLEGEKAINTMKSLVQKGAVIIIPFTDEEKKSMDEKSNTALDYLTPDWKYTKNGNAHVIVLDDNMQEISQLYNASLLKNFTFTKDYLNDLLSTAMEGGSNYWAEFDRRYIAPELAKQKIPFSEKIINTVWDYKKAIPVYDAESGEEQEQDAYDSTGNEFTNDYESFEKLGELSTDTILEAISLIKKDPKYSHVWENIATENYDAGDADVFFQLAIMGNVVFG